MTARGEYHLLKRAKLKLQLTNFRILGTLEGEFQVRPLFLIGAQVGALNTKCKQFLKTHFIQSIASNIHAIPFLLLKRQRMAAERKPASILIDECYLK